MLILASASPRRAALLEEAGLKFKIIPSYLDENGHDDLSPPDLVKHLALEKARQVAKMQLDDVVIGADTVVVYQQEVLGKPKDERDAYRMLRLLSGQAHFVYTGVAVVQRSRTISFCTEAKVWMNELSDLDIKNYIESKEPFDKAGSYAIQGEGGKLVNRYEGDFFTIVGLPLKELLKVLNQFEKIEID
jgi:septum formation protein